MKLREYLKKNKIRLFDFAEALNITYKTLYCIIRGADMKLTIAMKIQELTNQEVTCEDLFGSIKRK